MQRRTFITATLAAALATPALAADPPRRRGALVISDAWIRPSLPGAPNGAGYLIIRNTGPVADRLLGGSTPVAATFEVHEMSMAGGIMRMRPLPQGLPIPPRRQVRLQPGGFHLMLIGLRRPLNVGDRIPIRLRFARAGEIEVAFTVERRVASAGPSHGNP